MYGHIYIYIIVMIYTHSILDSILKTYISMFADYLMFIERGAPVCCLQARRTSPEKDGNRTICWEKRHPCLVNFFQAYSYKL